MTKFKLNFNKIIFISILVIIGLAIAGTVINIISLTRANEKFFDFFLPIFSTVLMLVVATFAVLMLIFSYYEISDEFLLVRSGVLVTKITVESITEIITIESNKGKKLAISYGDNNARFFIQIKESDFNDFSSSLINKNPKIAYSVGVENQNPTQK